MRLLILGLDGLDPDLVERWRLGQFAQRCHGRHYVGFLKTLYTPIAWACFLTGRNAEAQGYDIEYIHEERARKLWGPLYPLYAVRRRLIKRKLGVRKLLIRLGLLKAVYTPNMPMEMKPSSFIDELASRGFKVYVHEVPGYNEEHNEYFRTALAKMVGQPFEERKRLAEEALEETRRRVAEGLKQVYEGCDLVFVYSPLPDLAFHAVTKPTATAVAWLLGLHHRLYGTIKPLMEVAYGNGYAVLIASDHGFNLKEYYHSDYGFWSLSVEPPTWWRIHSILDFKESIVRLVAEV